MTVFGGDNRLRLGIPKMAPSSALRTAKETEPLKNVAMRQSTALSNRPPLPERNGTLLGTARVRRRTLSIRHRKRRSRAPAEASRQTRKRAENSAGAHQGPSPQRSDGDQSAVSGAASGARMNSGDVRVSGTPPIGRENCGARLLIAPSWRTIFGSTALRGTRMNSGDRGGRRRCLWGVLAQSPLSWPASGVPRAVAAGIDGFAAALSLSRGGWRGGERLFIAGGRAKSTGTRRRPLQPAERLRVG